VVGKSRVVVIGNANVDVTSYVPEVPAEGETVLSDDFSIGMGGKGANQAVASSRAGSPTAFIGAVGSDSFGDYMWQGLASESLNLDSLARLEGQSGVASIMVDRSGANRIAVFVGASGLVTTSDADKAISTHVSGRFLISQLEISQEVVAASLAQAKSQGMTTVVNTAPYRPLSEEMLANTDWIIANEVEAGALLADSGIDTVVGESPESVIAQISSWSHHLGVNLVITLGKSGAVGVERDGVAFHAHAPRVKAVDTVGAGDCFVGYFVALLDQGFSWQQAMTGAVGAASWSVQHPGAQSSYPPRESAEEFLHLARNTVLP
jgi:ribokinase